MHDVVASTKTHTAPSLLAQLGGLKPQERKRFGKLCTEVFAAEQAE
ncbi:hypothetical protein VITFI_CDS1444 [Vitreoscilla filiformis]|jgi:hypothetical protein|uniref:Uncharacterized protein n=1 Tax=Vitreoscilla filiformis TaxID=63 RepID=A0A221KDX7_VITFI|nr:hypothetical protein VITFI_CDS1444 [Vitreoscilla filiformis]